MKFFIDSADIEEIKEAISWGIVDGITTNPSLIKKAAKKHQAKDMQSYIAKIFDITRDLPVSLEVISTDHENMFKEGKRLYKLFKQHGNVVIKVPINSSEDSEGKDSDFEALQTIQRLSSEDIPVNVTLIMNPEQALVAAKAGARYVSPFAGRIDDHIRKKHDIDFEKTDYYESCEERHDKGVFCGVDLVEQIKDIFNNYHLDCEIIAASLRNPRQVRECALVGSDIATIPFSVLKNMLKHEKTHEGIKKFKQDVVPEYKELFNNI